MKISCISTMYYNKNNIIVSLHATNKAGEDYILAQFSGNLFQTIKFILKYLLKKE